MNRYQTLNYTTGSIAGSGGSLQVNVPAGPSSLNIAQIVVTQDTPGGSLSFHVYTNSSFASNKCLIRFDAQQAPLNQPLNISGPSPVLGLQGREFPYDDENETGDLHLEFVNGDSIAHVYTLTIQYEEVPVFDASGDATFRGGIIANGASTINGTLTVSGKIFANGGIDIGGFTPNSMLYAGASGVIVDTGAAVNGQFLIGGTSSPPALGTITGTTSQVIVTNGVNSITLSLPQNINTAAVPTFGGLIVPTVGPTSGEQHTVPNVASDTFALLAAAQTFTGKSISGSANTFTNIPNSALVNPGLMVLAGTGLSGGGAVLLGSSVTLSNAGVLSIAGAANQVIASASTGAITLSLPQSIATTSSVTFGGLSLGGYLTNYNGGAPANGQLLIGDTANGRFDLATLTPGTNVTISNGGGTITINVPAGAGGVSSITGTAHQVIASASTGAVTLSLPQSIDTTSSPQFASITIPTIVNTGTLTLPTATDTLVGRQTTDTLTNKTISGSSNTLTNIGNGSLTNSSVTVTAGTGMSGGGTVALGASITLTNAGVTSIAGTAAQISASASTGAVTLSLIGPYTPATYTANGVLYGNGASSILATAQGASGTVLHGNGGVPTFSAVSLTVDVSGVLPLANGGTNGNLTASNGGVVYSTASALAVLAATATANQALLSGSSGAPAWSTATYPATTTVNQLLYSSSASVIAGLATANNGVLITSSGGVPSIGTTLPSAVQGNITSLGTIVSYGGSAPLDGQLLIGSTAGGYFTAATLTPGTNITITNAGGSITIAASGGAGGVSSISGTANQITASASTGAVTLSLPNAITTPGSLTTTSTLAVGTYITSYNGAAPTNGQLLIGDTSNNRFDIATLTGTAAQIGITNGGGSITLALIGPYTPASYTANGILYGAGASSIAVTAAGNNGVLVTSSGGAPSISSALPAAVQGNITAVGTIASGTWQGSLIALAYGGTNANLTASNGGIFYSTASAAAILSGTATANQVLLSGSSTAPAWSTATYPATTTVNQLLYSSSASVIAGLATANSATLVTSSGGVPSLSQTLPSAVQANITTVGTIGTGVWQGTPVALAYGGTNANLTASNGGIFYSTASAGAILSGTATANQILLSGASGAPAWSTVTHPATTTVNQLLYSSSANVLAGLATANNAVLVTSSGGVPSIAAPGVSLTVSGSVLNTIQNIRTTDSPSFAGLALSGLITTYDGVATAGLGIAAIFGSGRSVGATAAVSSVAAYTVGGSDGSFEILANVNITSSTTHNFNVVVIYTDETNTSRTLTLPFTQLGGVPIQNLTNVTGVSPYSGTTQRIRCKASTTITVKTTGTFTSVVYNVEADIRQCA